MDTFVYSVRLEPNGLTLVGSDQLDTLVRPLGDGIWPTTWWIRRTETEGFGWDGCVLRGAAE